MKTSELRAKTPAELAAELEALRREQFNLRVQRGIGETPKTHLYKQIRQKIAKINTILNERARVKS